MDGFTILLLGAHSVQKGCRKALRPQEEPHQRINCAVPHRVELRSGEPIDGVILRLSPVIWILKVNLAGHFHTSMSETHNLHEQGFV